MSVITLTSVVAAHTATRTITAAQLKRVPEGYVTAERVTAAGGKLTAKGAATLPLAGIRHLSAECSALAADMRTVGAKQAAGMLSRGNGRGVKRATVPCPACFAAFYAAEAEKAAKAGKVYVLDADTLRMVAVAPPKAAPRKRRAAAKK